MINCDKKCFFLISQVFYPDEVSTANLFTQLCTKISEDPEIKVKVWCAQPSYTYQVRQPREINFNKVEIHFLLSTNFQKDKIIGRLFNYLTFTFSVTFKLLFNKEKSPVFTHTTPPSLGIILAFICKVKKRQFNYILLDIFPDGLIRLGKLKPDSLVVKMWQRIHLAALKRCSKIIVIGRDMQQWLVEFYPESIEKLLLIHLWQDETLIQPIEFESNPFADKYALKDKFVVQYSGNMGLWTELKTLGEAVNHKPENVLFCFIGGGMRRDELLSSFRKKNPENVVFFPFLSNTDYSLSVTACHVAFVTLQKNLIGIAVPSKIFGIMAAGIPIIGIVPRNSEISYIIEEEKCGIVIDPGDTMGLLNALTLLKNNEEIRREMGLNGRKAFLNKYTLSIIADNYIKMI